MTLVRAISKVRGIFNCGSLGSMQSEFSACENLSDADDLATLLVLADFRGVAMGFYGRHKRKQMQTRRNFAYTLSSKVVLSRYSVHFDSTVATEISGGFARYFPRRLPYQVSE